MTHMRTKVMQRLDRRYVERIKKSPPPKMHHHWAGCLWPFLTLHLSPLLLVAPLRSPFNNHPLYASSRWGLTNALLAHVMSPSHTLTSTWSKANQRMSNVEVLFYEAKGGLWMLKLLSEWVLMLQVLGKTCLRLSLHRGTGGRSPGTPTEPLISWLKSRLPLAYLTA